MITGEWMMPNGRYKFRRLNEIPAEYLVNIFNNPKGQSNKELVKYVQDNIEEIKKRLGKPIPDVLVIPFICSKMTYATEKLARDALKKIVRTQDGRKKPVRVYECPDCSGWHLTSVPIETFK